MSTPIPDALLTGLASALLSKGVNELWELVKLMKAGTMVRGKKDFHDAQIKPLSTRKGSQSAALLSSREKQIADLYKFYAAEPDKLVLGSNIRIGYAHQAWFVTNMPGAIDFSDLTVESSQDYDVDQSLEIQGFRKTATRFRTERGIRLPSQGPAVRVSSWDGKQRLALSKADYIDQFVTNQMPDTPIGDIKKFDPDIFVPPYMLNQTLRNLNASNGLLLPFEESRLSNTLGVSAIVVTSDGYLIVPKRGSTGHFEQSYNVCSIAGVLEWTSKLLTDFPKEVAAQLVNKEGTQEILLDQYRISTPRPLALAREFARAGKPQLFFNIWSDDSLENFKSRWQVSDQPYTEMETIGWFQIFDPNQLRDPSSAVNQMIERLFFLLTSEAFSAGDKDSVVILSEEMRANLFYFLGSLVRLGSEAFPTHWRPSIIVSDKETSV